MTRLLACWTPLVAVSLSVLACTSRPSAPSQPPRASSGSEPAGEDSKADLSFELTRLRRSHRTNVFSETSRFPAPEPPPEVFERVHYPAPLGSNVAYVTPVSAEGNKPAIVWIAGGFDWGIDSGSWEPAPRSNDQTAAAFRKAGVVLMRPSLRGSNDNPGRNECFLGEVDDVIAAGRYLASRPDVDPERVYVGGHSTGGTLALLVAASTDRFRAVIAFGPAADPRQYGRCIPPTLEGEEARLRTPTEFLDQVRAPTLIIEGIGGNTTDFGPFEAARGDAPVQLLAVPGADHFDVLAPVSELVAKAILEDRDFRAPDVVSLVDANRAVVGEGGVITPAAQRLVRAARWPAIFRKVLTTSIDVGCRTEGTDPEVCRMVRSLVSETVLEALVVEVVSRHIPPEAIAEATAFYESEAGVAISGFLLDPEGPRPTAEQQILYEQYRAHNTALEGPQGEALIGAAIDGYFERVFQ